MKILMVCLGNICRSPLAEGILQDRIDNFGLDWMVDSAGIGNWHVGELPDLRSINEAQKHGINISNQRARHFTKKDFKNFDYILVMDASNYNDAIRLAQNEEDKNKVHMIMNFVEPNKNIVVPDPYYDNRFSLVYDMLTEAIDAFVDQHVKKN